jgi:predicted transcriptional regulator
MNSLYERLNLAKIVLAELSKQSLRNKELEKKTVMKGGTHATFEGMFRFLIQYGYVEKTERRHCAPFCMTKKGRKFLEGLSDE